MNYSMTNILSVKILVMKKITYVFIQGRKENYLKKNIESQDFYYGMTYFSKKGYEVNIIEFEDESGISLKVIKYLDLFINKFFSIPMYMHKILRIKNLKTMFKSNNIVLVTESVGFSLIPFLIILKPFNIQVTIFVMGLYSKKLRFPLLKPFHYFFIKLLVVLVDNVLLLGHGEYLEAKRVHKNSNKFLFFPFCIDTVFWENRIELKSLNNDKIIFVGNDGNRDYELLIKIANKLKEFQFIFVSENNKLQQLNLPNVKVIKGSWGKKFLTDNELKEIYLASKFIILPLKDSLQPSGQSVALQAMSLGIPVMISKTIGFWDNENFIDGKNILFVSPNNFESWVSTIKHYIDYPEKLNFLGINGKTTIKEKFNLEKFNANLEKVLNSNI